MFLPLPDILRFKGKNAPAFCDLWETALRGRCKREGNTLVLKEQIKVSVNGSNGATTSFSGAFELSDVGSNGRKDARRV